MGNQLPIPGHEDDTILFSTRKHLASMIGTIFLVIVMVVVPLILAIAAAQIKANFFHGPVMNFLIVFGSIYYLVVAAFAFTQWASYYFDVFFVTDKEIIDIEQEGFFDRRITEVTILRIQDVSARIKGFWPTLFGYGDVVAESAGENSHTYVIDNVPDPLGIANRILQLHNQHIEKEERADEVIIGEGDFHGGAGQNNCPPGCQPSPRPCQNGNFQPIDKAQSEQENQPSNQINANSIQNSLGQSPKTNTEEPSQGVVNKNDLDQGGEFRL